MYRTAEKILEEVFFWPLMFHDTQKFVEACDKCQRSRNLTKHDEMNEADSYSTM